MIAPRQMYSPAAEESDPSLYLPQETVVSVQGISIPVPTRLLVHGSAYWAARVIEHAQACRSATMSRLPSLLTTPPPALPPIILDESTHGICFSAYEFTVYVSLLQAEEHLRVALALELPPPGPLHGPLFRSFVAAGMPMPSAQALDNVSRMAVFFGRTDLARRVPLPPQQMLPERLNRRPRDSSASSYMQTTTAQQQGHQQRQERQARQDLWNSQLNVCKNERAGTTATHVATHTSYDNVLAGLVPLTAPPSPSGWADCTMVETPFSSCSLEDDPVYLPPMRSPLPSGFYDPPPTPHLRHTPGLRPLAAMEPPLLPSPPSMHRLGLPPVASPLPVSTPPTTTPGFFPLLPLPPRVDASQGETIPIHSSPPRFPERFQSGRAATRHHHHHQHHESTPHNSVIPITESTTKEEERVAMQPHAQRRQVLPDATRQHESEYGPSSTGQQNRHGVWRGNQPTRKETDLNSSNFDDDDAHEDAQE